MIVFFKFKVFWRTLKALSALAMSKNGEKVFYAVGRGKEVGIYESWKECKAQTEGVNNAKFRKFYSYDDAEEFVNFWKNYSTPEKESPASENPVSKVADQVEGGGSGRQLTHKKQPDKSYHVLKKNKIRKCVLGCETTEQDWNQEGTLQVLPYTSPLSTNLKSYLVGFVGNKLTNTPLKAVNSTNLMNRLNDLRMFNGCFPEELTLLNKQENLKNKSGKSFKSSNSSLDNSDVFNAQVSTPVTPDNTIPLNGHAVEKEMSEPCSGISCDGCADDDVLIIEKERRIYIDSGGGKSTKVREELTLCLNLLGSVLKVITKQNINMTEKLKNFLQSFLEQTVTETNTNINPQMEPQEKVDVICEDTKNFDKLEPVGIRSTAAQGPPPRETLSPQLAYAGRQPSPSRLSPVDGRVDHKSADVLALNFRLDSFEKRFDACLKEIGAIAAEISHIKSDIKELRETMSSSPKSRPTSSPSKSTDGRVQTTLCFDSNNLVNSTVRSQSATIDAESEDLRGRGSLKRKLSRSNSNGKSKRFAEDDVDDFLSRIKTEKVDYTTFTFDEDEYVEVFTDGSALSNGSGDARAGIGVWFGDNHPLNVSEPVVGPPTNNNAEIQAARVAVQLAIKAGITKLKIHTDSEFLINCVTKWIHRWKKNGWTVRDGGPVKNKKELEKLDKVASKISVRWEKVLAHSNIRGNEIADRLANEGAAKYER